MSVDITKLGLASIVSFVLCYCMTCNVDGYVRTGLVVILGSICGVEALQGLKNAT